MLDAGADWELGDRQAGSLNLVATVQHLSRRRKSKDTANPATKFNQPARNATETTTFFFSQITILSLFRAFVFNGFSNACIAPLPRRIVELKPADEGSAPSAVSGYFLLGCSIM